MIGDIGVAQLLNAIVALRGHMLAVVARGGDRKVGFTIWVALCVEW